MIKENLIKYITNNLNEADAAGVRELINTDSEYKKEFIRLKNIMAFSSSYFGNININSEFERISNKLKFRKQSKVRRIIYTGLKYAAVILFAVTIGYGTSELELFKTDESVELVMNEMIAPNGQISEFILSDGTHVWLNSGTTIKFPSCFSNKKRDIYLEGEAYFEVSENKKWPFFVHSGKMITKVLGTEFNISAYSDNQFLETTLINGSVEIQDHYFKKVVILKPGQQFVHSRDNKINKVRKVDTRPFEAWKDGELIFRNRSLDEIKVKLERWYNVDITFGDEKVKAFRFSGTILKDKPFDQVLQAIKLTLPIGYKIDVIPDAKNKILLYSLK